MTSRFVGGMTLRAVFALLTVWACACAPSRPEVAPHSTFAPTALRPTTFDKELEVGFTSPRGDTPGDAEINVVFNKPIRRAGESAPPPAIAIEPPVNGSWEWIGSRAIHFVHTAPLPSATTFTVRIPAGLAAIDGTTLAKEVQWTFQTPRPAVIGTLHGPLSAAPSVHDALEGPLPSTEEPKVNLAAPPGDATDPIRIRFNQPIHFATLESTLRVTRPSPKGSVPVQVALSALSPTEVVIRPKNVLKGETIRIATGKLRSAEGPLEGESGSFVLQTRGPLRLLSMHCVPH
jgi:hypothetical protein